MGCIFLSCHKTGRLLRNTSVTAALSQLHQSSQLVHPLFVLQWASSYYEWNNMAKNFRKGPRLKNTLSCHCIHCIVFFLTTLFSQVDIAMPLCWLGLSHGRVAMPKIIACVFFLLYSKWGHSGQNKHLAALNKTWKRVETCGVDPCWFFGKKADLMQGCAGVIWQSRKRHPYSPQSVGSLM